MRESGYLFWYECQDAEKNALELKGEYVGSTAPIVKQCFQEAKGGTLFLDEAYGLASDNLKGGGDSFSKEAVRTLLTEVENNRTGTVVILAGYEDKMKLLMRADPGLPRRFPQYVHCISFGTYCCFHNLIFLLSFLLLLFSFLYQTTY